MGCFGFFNDGIMGSDIGVTVPRDSNQTWMAGNALNVCFSVCVFFRCHVYLPKVLIVNIYIY